MKTVAVVGASRDRAKFGNRAVRAFMHQGYAVMPVNPHEEEIEGLRAYPSVLDVPGTIDLVSLYVPPAVGLLVIEEVARKGTSEVWVNPGAESPELLARARTLGLHATMICSILGIGESPSAY